MEESKPDTIEKVPEVAPEAIKQPEDKPNEDSPLTQNQETPTEVKVETTEVAPIQSTHAKPEIEEHIPEIRPQMNSYSRSIVEPEHRAATLAACTKCPKHVQVIDAALAALYDLIKK